MPRQTKEIFRFHDRERTIEITDPRTPQPWINYLSNGRLHAFVSQAGGGFAWWKSPIVCRMTRYRQYNLPLDSPGFYIYLREADGTIWSPAFRPCETKHDSWKAEHGPGFTRFTAAYHGVRAVLTYFAAQQDDVLMWDLKLQSTDKKAHRLRIFAVCEFSQTIWEDEIKYGYYTRHHLSTSFDEATGTLNYLNHTNNYPASFEQPLIWLGASVQPDSYCGSRNALMGDYGDERRPAQIEAGTLGKETIDCGEAAGALQMNVTLPASGNPLRRTVFLGVSEKIITARKKAEQNRKKTIEKYRRDGAVDQAFAEMSSWWKKRFDVMQCELPDKTAERQINTWNVMNSVVTGRYSRSVNVEAPGVRGVGFRDSCQDLLATAYRDPEGAREMLLYLLTQQFEDGHTVHLSFRHEWFAPGRTVHSDDHLWLPLPVYAIIAETGDLSLLGTPVEYCTCDLKEGEKPEIGTVWEHLMRAIRFTETHLGAHGLPLTLRSDWNDIIGKFNRRGQGETVFAAQQYVYALRLLMELAEAAGKKKDLLRLTKDLKQQTAALEKCAWDGKWWRRGFDDDGNPVGSRKSTCGKIFLNTQSWSVIGKIGKNDQNRTGMDSAWKALETPVGLKLMAPGFSGWNRKPGETPTGYGPGTGENGAIFCHANTWAVIAESLLRNGNRAWKYFTQLIPANVIRTVGLSTYRSEPYAWVSNIVGPENKHFGWGNVTQISGTAPWMDVASTQYLLGVRATIRGLLIDPVLPDGWKQMRVTRIFAGCKVEITVDNPSGKPAEKRSAEWNGKDLPLNEEGQLLLSREFLKGKKQIRIGLHFGR